LEGKRIAIEKRVVMPVFIIGKESCNFRMGDRYYWTGEMT